MTFPCNQVIVPPLAVAVLIAGPDVAGVTIGETVGGPQMAVVPMTAGEIAGDLMIAAGVEGEETMMAAALEEQEFWIVQAMDVVAEEGERLGRIPIPTVRRAKVRLSKDKFRSGSLKWFERCLGIFNFTLKLATMTTPIRKGNSCQMDLFDFQRRVEPTRGQKSNIYRHIKCSITRKANPNHQQGLIRP